jgi:hypothetical protein
MKSLFPISRAFQLFIDNNKRKLIKGLSKLPESIRQEIELVYLDAFPDTTRFPEKWENVFSVLFSGGELPKRRNILDSLWKINAGGQSAFFIQGILQGVENIRVVENVPIIDPLKVFDALDLAVCDNELMICEGEWSICDYRLGDQNFEPSILKNDTSSIYTIPNNKEYWSVCFFVCKEAWRDGNNNIIYVESLELDMTWKNYIEYLILKIKPVHSTAIIFIDWKQGAIQ